MTVLLRTPFELTNKQTSYLLHNRDNVVSPVSARGTILRSTLVRNRGGKSLKCSILPLAAEPEKNNLKFDTLMDRVKRGEIFDSRADRFGECTTGRLDGYEDVARG